MKGWITECEDWVKFSNPSTEWRPHNFSFHHRYNWVVDGAMDLLFIVSAAWFNLLIAGVFIAQRHMKTRLVRLLGIALLCLSVPFSVYLIFRIRSAGSQLISVSLSTVLLYLLVEFSLDFIFQYNFRSRWITHVPYIILEYAAFFALIIVSSTISQMAVWLVGVTFWIAMAGLVYMYAGNRKMGEKRNPLDNK